MLDQSLGSIGHLKGPEVANKYDKPGIQMPKFYATRSPAV